MQPDRLARKREYAHKKYWADPEATRAYKRTRHRRVRELGQCLDCTERAVPGNGRCQAHIDAVRARRNVERGIWRGMIERCTPGKDRGGRYAGRGISVCERWKGDHGFENFMTDMGQRPSPKHSIDRIDNDGNYEPGNCRWATLHEQNTNRSTNRMVTWNGETLTITDWARRKGMRKTALAYRIDHWGVDEALSVDGRRHVRGSRHKLAKLSEDQVEQLLRRRLSGERGSDLAREFGVTETVVSRISLGRNWGHIVEKVARENPELRAVIERRKRTAAKAVAP